MDKFYITTPIYYVSDKPHIGHAYTTIAADVTARYWRKKIGRENVFFLTGTDEHGAKVAEAAKMAGKEPQDFVDELAENYQITWERLGLGPDYFIRTTDPEHVRFVQNFIEDLYQKGEITKGIYQGLYCVSCEKFVTESELVNGFCPDHPNKKPIEQKEENYFFALSKWAPQVVEAIRSGELTVSPESRKNEILSRIEQGVEDISISRASVSWGVPIPWDKSQTIYVWFDALLNYASALKLVGKEDFWPPIHLIGKEILWFHAVIWPAMLLAAGHPLPKQVFAHGWFTMAGQKMSKTLGNVIDPLKLVEEFGVDATRYFLLTAARFGQDGDVSLSRFKTEYMSDLANGLGNLLQRTLVLCNKFGIKTLTDVKVSCAAVDKLTEELRFDEALEEIWKLIAAANLQLDREAPWSEQDANKRQQTLTSLLNQISTIGTALEPYLPETVEKIYAQLSGRPPEPLFPRK